MKKLTSFGVVVAVLALGASGEWIGRKCCEYAMDAKCRTACLQRKSRDILDLHCTHGIETNLFGCIFRHQKKKRCCGKSLNMTTVCQQFCVMSFRSESGPTTENLRHIERHCPADVLKCTNNFSLSSRKYSDGIVCCDQSNSEKCVNGCSRIMRSALTEKEKIDGIVEICGEPVPREPMWRCLLSRNGENYRPSLPRIGPDLQCCSKAISPNCRQLCRKLYSRPWESSLNWQYFQQRCEYNPDESALSTCLHEVREPCKMGCSGLGFCTNFNNRPTESFRSCNVRADNIARMQIREWQKGIIQLPVVSIPVVDIESCQPEKWKAAACSMEVKPCGTSMTDSKICRRDCISLLHKCADASRFERDVTIERLCDILSPLHLQQDCISLDKYAASSETPALPGMITQPCYPNPCDEDKICVVNKDECLLGETCQLYNCLQGCKVGDVGDVLVHVGQRVKIQDANRGEGCYRACACTTIGKLQYCTNLPCMDRIKSCTIVGQVKLHGSHFKIDCNFCTCYNGRVTCTKRQCAPDDANYESSHGYTGLPCNCDYRLLPVCAWNGRTYPSACLARCMGHGETEIDFGSCRAKDPCKSKPCKRNERCVSASRVCLSSSSEIGCQQYECIAPYSRCMNQRSALDSYARDGHHYVNHRRLNSASRRTVGPTLFFGFSSGWDEEPVCDTEGMEYRNICQLRKTHRQAKLAYRGSCKTQCNGEEKPVCGQDVVTYPNECSALAERVLVDYFTECGAIGAQKVPNEKSRNCANVACLDLSHSECEPVVPSGACCPVCGGMLRILYSQEHVDDAAKSAIHGPVAVRDIIRSLRRQIRVRECDLFGHLTVEADIAVLIIPVIKKPTMMQIESCVTEAERLGRHINERNPMFHFDVILSTLTAAEVHGRKKLPNSSTSSLLKFDLPWSIIFTSGLVEALRLMMWIGGISLTHYITKEFAFSVG